MDMVFIATSVAASTTVTVGSDLGECWRQNEKCQQKVFIDGHVIFHNDYQRNLQYTPTFEVVGMVYGMQPGKMFMPLYFFSAKIFSRI